MYRKTMRETRRVFSEAGRLVSVATVETTELDGDPEELAALYTTNDLRVTCTVGAATGCRQCGPHQHCRNKKNKKGRK